MRLYFTFSRKKNSWLAGVIFELDFKLDILWQVIRRNAINTVSLAKHFFLQTNQKWYVVFIT